MNIIELEGVLRGGLQVYPVITFIYLYKAGVPEVTINLIGLTIISFTLFLVAKDYQIRLHRKDKSSDVYKMSENIMESRLTVFTVSLNLLLYFISMIHIYKFIDDLDGGILFYVGLAMFLFNMLTSYTEEGYRRYLKNKFNSYYK